MDYRPVVTSPAEIQEAIRRLGLLGVTGAAATGAVTQAPIARARTAQRVNVMVELRVVRFPGGAGEPPGRWSVARTPGRAHALA